MEAAIGLRPGREKVLSNHGENEQRKSVPRKGHSSQEPGGLLETQQVSVTGTLHEGAGP